MPMVENDEITGTMRGDGENDPVSEFIGTVSLCWLTEILFRISIS